MSFQYPPHYLPRKFTAVFIVAVYVPPWAKLTTLWSVSVRFKTKTQIPSTVCLW